MVGVATDSPAEMEKKIEARTKVEVFKGSIEASGKGLEKSKEYIVDLLMNKELKLAIQEIAFLQKEIGVFVGRVRSFKADIK